jgi:N-succinyldiaminopimelate aminotransferase
MCSHPGALISSKLRPFGTSIFGEMTRLALENEAINLSQGFPDFDGPPDVIDAVTAAMRAGHNQYARSMGHPLLVRAIAEKQKAVYGIDLDPMREVVVFSGATEGIFSSIMGLVEPGDEVILFEPFYDSYPACVAMAGGVPRYATLRFPRFDLDVDHLRRLFNAKTRLVVLNTPHNPTGKVFTRSELEAIAELALAHGAFILADEVYEHLTYDGARHVPMASIPGMRERTLSISSSGKTFSFTGWKIGWATGPEPLIQAAQAAHQFVTFATSTPMQVAIAGALSTHGSAFYAELQEQYAKRRDLLAGALADVGFEVALPRGAYFILADFTRLRAGDDVSFAKELVTKYKVAAIPPTSFYAASPAEGRRLVRFAFCKKEETLRAAAERLRALTRPSGP